MTPIAVKKDAIYVTPRAANKGPLRGAISNADLSQHVERMGVPGMGFDFPGQPFPRRATTPAAGESSSTFLADRS